MFKVIETAGYDEPWWFFDDWKKMIIASEEFEQLKDAIQSFQLHAERLQHQYPEKREKGATAIAFWTEKEMDYCVSCECDVQLFHGLIVVDENDTLVEWKGENRG